MNELQNVLGESLEECCTEPLTGFYRDGCCRTGADDIGLHVVCAQMTAEFLEFSRRRGNDLITPRPEFLFPGLKPGDCWCLCSARCQEALEAGVAPPIKLAATHMSALEFISMADLERYAIDKDDLDLSVWQL